MCQSQRKIKNPKIKMAGAAPQVMYEELCDGIVQSYMQLHTTHILHSIVLYTLYSTNVF